MTKDTAKMIPLLLSLLSCISANSNIPNNNNNNNNLVNNNHDYSVNQNLSIDLSTKDSVMAFYTQDAMFCNGGDSVSTSDAIFKKSAVLDTSISNYESEKVEDGTPFVALTECAFVPTIDIDQYGMNDNCDDEDDDDDDTDDDGHSSILSNVSVRNKGRSLASANGYASSAATNNRLNGKYTFNSSLRSSDKSKYNTSTAFTKAMGVRGGGGAAISDEFVRRLIVAALVTLLYEGAIGHLLEFLKIVMQTAPLGTTYRSVLKDITSEKGIVGIWDGFVPWGVVQAIGKGGVFGLAHAIALSYLKPLAEQGKLPMTLALTIAGGIGGGFQGYVLSPTLLLKTRVMTNPVFREKMNLIKTVILSLSVGFDVVANEGILALMKGSNIFALKRVFDWSTRFFFSDLFETLILNSSSADALTASQKIVASLLGGAASTITTLPLDVLVAKSQDAKKAGVKVSVMKTFLKDYEEGGLKGLYDANMMGFEARLAHVCFTTVAMKAGTGIMYDYLFGKKE